jgi:hypothetical protein
MLTKQGKWFFGDSVFVEQTPETRRWGTSDADSAQEIQGAPIQSSLQSRYIPMTRDKSRQRSALPAAVQENGIQKTKKPRRKRKQGS